ncbi:DUF2744 domain-containing protein [Rhodococcus sp. 15-2388-1-1a]|uniref:phage gene 29 protein family protein n=1 Tax=Nocardiaceae TaxID=85025 RepID=UPI00068F9D79|nr:MULTISPECIES: DUF2744 domain-containing protein [Rhodococcus]OZE92121.1 DUF2744 domain-containing protein [Rhodococcus sp. 15-2388-1-1a]
MAIPLQAFCDPDDPEEAALWALLGLEDGSGVPMIVPEVSLRKMSKNLIEYGGFRHHPELQTKKAIIVGAPEAEGVHWMGVGMIEWVDIDHEEPVAVVEAAVAAEEPILEDSDLDQASAAQLIKLAEKLQERGVIRPPEAPTALDGYATDQAAVSSVEVD